MNNFGFNSLSNGLSNENPLMQYLKQYTQQQSIEQPQSNVNPQPNNYSGIKVYEIMAKDDLKYIKPDNTGQKQIIWCESEKEMYIARYNYATEKPDYEKYISEGNIELFKKNDTSAEMSQIAEALVAVVNKLESMDNVIHEIKNIKPVEIIKEVPVEVIKEIIREVPKTNESNRKPNGQFKKKGEI